MAKKRNLFGARQISDAITNELGTEGHNPFKVQSVLSGVTNFYDSEFLEWHPTCLAIARLFKRHVSNLFPIKGMELPDKPNHEALRRRANRESLRAILKEEGYANFTDFAMQCDLSQQRLNNVAGAGIDNYSKHYGRWSADALQIADALGRSPEAVFGIPDEIQKIHETVRAVAVKEGTMAGIDLDPFFEVPLHKTQLDEVHYRQAQVIFPTIIGDAIASGVLTERQIRVLEKRLYGEYKGMTLVEIGVKEGVTKQRISQIEIEIENVLKEHVRICKNPNLLKALDM